MMIKDFKPKKVCAFNWSPNLAYAVGLIVTDGSLSKNKKCVTFTSKDIEQISNIKIILNMKAKIGINKNKLSEVYRLQFSNKQFYDWLLSIGLTPNKSLTISKIKIPNKYFIDFIRGHLDGDGSITTYIDKYNATKNEKYVYKRLFVRFISASQKHMFWLQQKLARVIHVDGRLHQSKINDVGNSMYILKFGKKESLKLLDKIYYNDNLPCLSRKRLVYTNFIDN